MHVKTFSIVAYDPGEHAFGVAVASKFLAVGAVVPWARASAGAVATQALGKLSFGPDGLRLMESGLSAREALDRLLADDPGRERRQVGLVDRNGGAAAHTGSGCSSYAGHRVGTGFSVQGNILTGPDVLDTMAEVFTAARGELAKRLLAALEAADQAGGDRRGKQSAALVVVREGGGYGGDNDRYLDLRVDDDPAPVRQLAHLVELHQLYFGATRPQDLLPIDTNIARELQTIMRAQSSYSGPANGVWDDASRAAFESFIGVENLEERWSAFRNPNNIDRVALEYLRKRFA